MKILPGEGGGKIIHPCRTWAVKEASPDSILSHNIPRFVVVHLHIVTMESWSMIQGHSYSRCRVGFEKNDICSSFQKACGKAEEGKKWPQPPLST